MISFFTKHPTAANLMMVLFVVIGIMSLPGIRRETLPSFDSSKVEIRILYPGATPEDVEEVICQRVEDALDGINFVDEISSEAREGMAKITVEMEDSGDFQVFMDDIDKEVNAISEFPAEVEDPIIKELGRTDQVVSIIVSGPMSVVNLKAYCEGLKDRMQEAGLSIIDIKGFSDHQFRVEVSDAALRRLNMSISQLAQMITDQNIDLPVGALETAEQDILLRFVDQKRSIQELEQLVIKAGKKGAAVLLKDVAVIRDTFDLAEDKIEVNGKRSAIVAISKTEQQDSLRIASQVKHFVEEERLRQPQLDLIITQDKSLVLADRMDMLLTNGWQGLILVFLTMWLFFNLRISFWVVMGLPVSFFGAFFFLPFIGLTINMMSMVGLLLALGLMMDDAIVIAENIASHRQRNKGPVEAVIAGVREVSAGVASSFITTLCVLGPLAFIDGQMGKVLKVIPMILILVLAVSLIEAFCILPAHMGHAMESYTPEKSNRVRKIFERFIEWLRETVVGRTVDFLLGWRYLFIGSVVALFIFSIGMIASGRIKVQGLPEIEGDVIVARLLLPQGTPLQRTEQRVEQILQGLAAMNQEFKHQQPREQDLVQSSSVQFNQNTDAYENGPHVATVTVDLLSAEGRVGQIDDYTAVWQEKIGLLPDVISLTLGEPVFGPSGRPIEIRVRGKDLDHMKLAIEEMKIWFHQFAGVIHLDDDLRPGKPELRMKLRDGATNLGIDAAAVARQIRAGFHGVTANELQVDSENYAIDVRFAHRDQNSLADLENFTILVNGRQVPLTTLVVWEKGQGRSRIARHNGMRAITLRGDVDGRIANANELIMAFRNTLAKELANKYPELKITIAGESKESAQTQGSMMQALLIGLIGIFILLSFQFRSYTEPLIVMIAIPLSLIGVIWGHFIMGIPISMPSIMGFIALAGIVVNDSILLVLFLKNARAEGLTVQRAAGQASRSRFRAVLLTSATTIAGLLPLLFETSTQAQILIPLVVSTTFGLMASTLLVLLFIPCFYLVLGDFGKLAKIQTNQ